MRRKTRTKVKKYLKIVGIIIGIILIIVGIIFAIKLSKRPQISYDDGLVCKNYFKEITIDLSNKEVKRDNKKSSLTEEFDITEEQASLGFTTKEEMLKLLSDSVFEISDEGQILKIKNPYQTKTLLVKAEDIKQTVEGTKITELSNNLYALNFYSEKLTKAMYNYYKEQNYIQKVYCDEIYIDKPINDISQTVYGESRSRISPSFTRSYYHGIR